MLSVSELKFVRVLIKWSGAFPSIKTILNRLLPNITVEYF